MKNPNERERERERFSKRKLGIHARTYIPRPRVIFFLSFVSPRFILQFRCQRGQKLGARRDDARYTYKNVYTYIREKSVEEGREEERERNGKINGEIIKNAFAQRSRASEYKSDFFTSFRICHYIYSRAVKAAAQREHRRFALAILCFALAFYASMRLRSL